MKNYVPSSKKLIYAFLWLCSGLWSVVSIIAGATRLAGVGAEITLATEFVSL